jgi:hypothetical protein
MTRLRATFLALPLFLALAQGCLAAVPNASWNTVAVDRMKVDDCVRWGARALQQEGFSVTPADNDLYGYKGEYMAILICSAPPTVSIVVTVNAGSDEATRQQQALQNRFQLESRMHERDRRR